MRLNTPFIPSQFKVLKAAMNTAQSCRDGATTVMVDFPNTCIMQFDIIVSPSEQINNYRRSFFSSCFVLLFILKQFTLFLFSILCSIRSVCLFLLDKSCHLHENASPDERALDGKLFPSLKLRFYSDPMIGFISHCCIWINLFLIVVFIYCQMASVTFCILLPHVFSFFIFRTSPWRILNLI